MSYLIKDRLLGCCFLVVALVVALVVTLMLAGMTKVSLAEPESAFLSNLKATKKSPVFTTYAATMERSEFTLDEGYHLRFYDPNSGIDLTSDTAGDWCLAFKRGARYVYELEGLDREPVITHSYPDIVKYVYHPFEDIQVRVTFLVYSSRSAVQEVVVRNLGGKSVELQVIPFLRNRDRAFRNVQARPDQNAITFIHEEYPDSWTLSHQVPYVDQVQNLFLLSHTPDRLASYHNYTGSHVQIPPVVDLGRKQVFRIWGRVYHNDGERCRHKPVRSRLMVLLDGDRRRILTEAAPRWGSASPSISKYGTYRVELGSFGNIHEGQQYAVHFLCTETGQCGMLSGTVGHPDSVRSVQRDLTLQANDLPKGSGRTPQRDPARRR